MTEAEVGLFARHAFRAPWPATDTPRSFREILADYRDQRLLIPEHQRDSDGWDEDKRGKYIKRLRDSESGSHPPGSFATYQVVKSGDDPSPIFLNDGYQRLSTLAALRANPAQFGMDEDGARLLLDQLISVQHRHYPSHDDAMRDFQMINNGTRLTPLELCAGVLKLMDGYKDHWEQILDDVHRAVESSEARVRPRTGRKRAERLQVHKRRRHTLALFYRFLIKETKPCHYPDVAAAEVQKYLDRREVIEWRLRKALEERGPEEARRCQELFRQFVDRETALLEQCLREVFPQGVALAPVTHRWLMDLGVWCRNNQTPVPSHVQFVKKLLQATGGRATFVRDGRVAATLSLCHLGLLPQLAEVAGMPDFCEKKRRQRRPALLPGYDHSHDEPFVINGEGSTSPEPASLNRSRGAQSRPPSERTS